jgi:hypothetical protein
VGLNEPGIFGFFSKARGTFDFWAGADTLTKLPFDACLSPWDYVVEKPA